MRNVVVLTQYVAQHSATRVLVVHVSAACKSLEDAATSTVNGTDKGNPDEALEYNITVPNGGRLNIMFN